MVSLPGIALLFAAATDLTAIDKAFERLYNFDFPGAHAIIDTHLQSKPDDALAYGVRASAFLFQELDRLGILESEFFAEDKRIIEKKKLQPDPKAREAFQSALQTAKREAKKVIASQPTAAQSLFALSLVASLQADYMAFVEKRQWQSLSYTRPSPMRNSQVARASISWGACPSLCVGSSALTALRGRNPRQLQS